MHVIGEAATEIVHIGQAAIAMGAPVDYFKDTVFNFPTFAEAYQGKEPKQNISSTGLCVLTFAVTPSCCTGWSE